MCYSSSSPSLYCMFLPASSDWIFLKDYKDVLFCFMLQSAAGGIAMLYCCWQWSGLVRSPHKMLGVQQLLPARWWADVSVGLIISWETDPLASYILQVVVSYRPQNEKKSAILGFTMEGRMYLNSCYSCFSAEYWLFLWDNRRVIAYRKHTLCIKRPPKVWGKTCATIWWDPRDCEIFV